MKINSERLDSTFIVLSFFFWISDEINGMRMGGGGRLGWVLGTWINPVRIL